MTERRVEGRVPIMALAQAWWKNEAGVSQTAPVKMEDTSASGACVRARKPISVGLKVSIKWHREQFSGTVMNCRPDGPEYLLGIRREPRSSNGSK